MGLQTKDAAAVQERGIDSQADAAGEIHSARDYGFAVAGIDSVGSAQAVSRHCMAEEVHSDTEAGHFDTEDRTTGHPD